MNVIESVLQYIAPHECFGCGAEGALLCPPCSLHLPAPVMAATFASDVPVCAVTAYKGVAKQLIYSLKFERATAAASDVARCMVRIIPRDAYEVVTYVPTATSRVRQRGYDQSRQIAKQVAAGLGLPCVSFLARTGHQRQVGTGRELRRQQMSNAFRPVHIPLIQKQRVLLIDDVFTTGATIGAAARVLRAAGAETVNAAVFAAA